MPVDYSQVYPELDGYFVRPLLVNPPLCTLAELRNGTYTIYDLEMFHQILEIKDHMKPAVNNEDG
jgi:hypothetical protein